MLIRSIIDERACVRFKVILIKYPFPSKECVLVKKQLILFCSSSSYLTGSSAITFEDPYIKSRTVTRKYAKCWVRDIELHKLLTRISLQTIH